MKSDNGMKISPVNAAATDPAAVPGLIAPLPQQTEPAAPETSAAEEAPEAEESALEEPAAELPEESSEEEAEAQESAEDGPVFEASDRRGSIAIDGTGVRFQLDDTEADFDWPEIGAVESSTSRFGRRLTVVVHTRAKRRYPAEVQAPDKGSLSEWTTALDAVLDAYFEE